MSMDNSGKIDKEKKPDHPKLKRLTLVDCAILLECIRVSSMTDPNTTDSFKEMRWKLRANQLEYALRKRFKKLGGVEKLREFMPHKDDFDLKWLASD